jgi:hypothetical protein
MKRIEANHIWYAANIANDTKRIWIHTCIIHATCLSPCCMPMWPCLCCSPCPCFCHVRAAWLCQCWMFKSMQNGQGHAAPTWTCSMDLDMYNSMDTYIKHGDGHAVWTWTCSMDKYMLFVPVHVHAACPCSCCTSMSMLDVHVHTACPSMCCVPFPCCMSVSLLLVVSLLHVHVYAAWIWTSSMDKDMQHGHWQAAGEWTWSMDMGMHHGQVLHAACPCSCPCCMSMLGLLDRSMAWCSTKCLKLFYTSSQPFLG